MIILLLWGTGMEQMAIILTINDKLLQHSERTR